MVMRLPDQQRTISVLISSVTLLIRGNEGVQMRETRAYGPAPVYVRKYLQIRHGSHDGLRRPVGNDCMLHP